MRVSALTLLLLGGLAGSAQAYQYNGARWCAGGFPLAIEINRNLEPRLADEQVYAAIVSGFSQWEAVNCSYARFEAFSRTNSTGYGVSDEHNVVSWRSDRWPESSTALGVTSTIFTQDGCMLDSDMIFNGVHHRWSTTGDPDLTDVESVATHESGHLLGMGHSRQLGATMWPATQSGDLSGRSLHRDDIAGICALYPNGAEPEVPPADPEVGGQSVGEACGPAGECVGNLLCIQDASDFYCTEMCVGDNCPAGYYCAALRDGGSVCARGDAPGPPPDEPPRDVGEPCGDRGQCGSGRFCIDHEGDFYCTGPCLADGECPESFFCAELVDGGGACARGQRVDPGHDDPPPQPEEPPSPPDEGSSDPPPGEGSGGAGDRIGMPCTEDNPCEAPLVCIEDVSLSGELVYYCSTFCGSGTDVTSCPGALQCIPLQGGGGAVCSLPPVPESDPEPEPSPLGAGAAGDVQGGQSASDSGGFCVQSWSPRPWRPWARWLRR